MEVLARNWWALALRGVLAVLFGIVAFVLPGTALLALAYFFGTYAFLDGVLAIASAVRAARRHERWGSLLVEGLFGIVAGAISFVWPGITALGLLYLIAAWMILTGVFEVVAAVRLRKEIRGELVLGLAGVLSVLAGIYMIASPRGGALALAWLIGSYAILFGVALLALAFRLRGTQGQGGLPSAA